MSRMQRISRYTKQQILRPSRQTWELSELTTRKNTCLWYSLLYARSTRTDTFHSELKGTLEGNTESQLKDMANKQNVVLHSKSLGILQPNYNQRNLKYLKNQLQSNDSTFIVIRYQIYMTGSCQEQHLISKETSDCPPIKSKGTDLERVSSWIKISWCISKYSP